MKSNRMQEKFRKIAEKTLYTDNLIKKVIIQDESGYVIYGSYHLDEESGGWAVTADVFDDTIYFGSKRSALAWCISYNHKDYTLAKTIHVLDKRLSEKQTNIDILNYKLTQKIDLDAREVLIARLSEDVYERQTYKKQLVRCIELTKLKKTL